MPSFTSLNANCAPGSAITMSQHATRPQPPPSACPCTRATTGAGQPSIVVEHCAQAQRVGDVLVVRQIDGRSHPLDVRAGGERRAVAREDARRARRRRRRTPRSARRSAPRRTRCAVPVARARPGARARRARPGARSCPLPAAAKPPPSLSVELRRAYAHARSRRRRSRRLRSLLSSVEPTLMNRPPARDPAARAAVRSRPSPRRRTAR